MVRALITLLAPALLAGCATPDYSRTDGPTAQAADNLVRYGSIAAAGTGGFFAGKALTGNNYVGAATAGGAAALAYAFNKFFDFKRQGAYEAGIREGESRVRAEILNDLWKREAIMGLPPEGASPPQPTIRRVYVPSRNVDGVVYAGGYQEVAVY